jgi:hypothetical protein
MIRINARMIAFTLPFLVIIPPILERARGFHSPEITQDILVVAALFSTIFGVCLLKIDCRKVNTNRRTHLVFSVLMAILIFLYLDLSFNGIKLIEQFTPFIGKIPLIQRVSIHFALSFLTIATLGIFVWMVGGQMLTILGVFFGSIFLSSMFISGQKPFENWSQNNTGNVKNSTTFAPEIYLIFDGMIGAGGIDKTIPEGQEFYELVMSFHERHGLTLYESVFSRHGSTTESIPNMLNYDFSKKASSKNYIEQSNSIANVVSNKLFDEVSGNGKGIVIYQTPFMNFCQHKAVIRCKTLEAYNPFNGYLSNNHSDRGRLYTMVAMKEISLDSITLNYIRLILKSILSRNELENIFGEGLIPGAPNYNVLSFDLWFSELTNDILEDSGNSNFFAHFILPHQPFLLNEECRSGSTWHAGRFLTEQAGFRGHAFEVERKRLYRVYYAQASCAYKKLDFLLTEMSEREGLKDVTVVLMGDHGSKLSAGKSINYVKRRDLVDNYSTLFSVKQKALSPRNVRETISLQQIISKRGQRFELPPIKMIEKTVLVPLTEAGDYQIIEMPSF